MRNRRILWHLSFWALYVISQSLVWMNAFETENIVISPKTGEELITRTSFPGTFWLAMHMELAGLPGKLLAVYANLYWLIPIFLLTKNWWKYILSVVGMLLAVTVFQKLLDYAVIIPLLVPANAAPPHIFTTSRFIQTLTVCTNVVAFTGAVKILFHYFDEKRHSEHLQRERLAAELQYLKTQINPHFFFNTLNNLYGMALEKSDKTPAVLLHLSGMMSYVLYEANVPDVALEKELHILESFIALEKLRHGDRVAVSFSVQGQTAGLRLPPLLLLPFVENAFKHSTRGSVSPCWINILLSVEATGLELKVENNTVDSPVESDHQGIGLENVQRRLELLFPRRYQMKITQNADRFLIRLHISL